MPAPSLLKISLILRVRGLFLFRFLLLLPSHGECPEVAQGVVEKRPVLRFPGNEGYLGNLLAVNLHRNGADSGTLATGAVKFSLYILLYHL